MIFERIDIYTCMRERDFFVRIIYKYSDKHENYQEIIFTFSYSKHHTNKCETYICFKILKKINMLRLPVILILTE